MNIKGQLILGRYYLIRRKDCCGEARSPTSKNGPHSGCDERTATLARYSGTSAIQIVRPCIPVPPWFCPALLGEMFYPRDPGANGSALGNRCEG